jgi:hypothetical protein
MSNHSHLLEAVSLAQAGDWDAAHQIAQNYSDSTANWIHAVLHKIEGDTWNSKYWYARSGGHQYEDHGPDVAGELAALHQQLSAAATK